MNGWLRISSSLQLTAIEQGETFQRAADEFTGRSGKQAVQVSRQKVEIFSGIMPGDGLKADLVRINQGPERRGGFSQFGQLGIIIFLSVFGPCAAALLHQPQADDVFQETNAVAEADFIGEIQFAALVGDDGLLGFRCPAKTRCRNSDRPSFCPCRASLLARAGVVSSDTWRRLVRRSDLLSALAALTVPVRTVAGRHDFGK